jgi:hypothetical protein
MACNNCKKKTGTISKAIPVKSTSSSQFAFRANVGLVESSFGSGEFLTNDTLTDESAIAFLKVNPNRISMFEIYPKDWMTMISDDKTQGGQGKSK